MAYLFFKNKMKQEVVKTSPELSTMDRLYKEVEDYNSPESKKKRKKHKILTTIGDVFFALVITVFAYFIVIVNLAKANNQIPFIFNYSFEYVETQSMVPTLPVGTIIISKKIDSNTEIKTGYKGDDVEGDIITFYDYSRTLVTHRAVETYVEGNIQYFITKGDNNIVKDPYPIPRSDLVSIYVGRLL